MRHWHWLQNVIVAAGVSHASALDRQTPQHQLWRAPCYPRSFESLALDGYDPGAMTAIDRQSLLDFVASKRGYAHATRSYKHGFWSHLAERNPKKAPPDSWIDAQLKKHELLRLKDIDDDHARTLGLRRRYREDDPDDLDSGSHVLVAMADAFANLDGMLALLILYREAVDKSDDSVDNLRIALVKSTAKFASELAFEDELLETWKFLVETRMLRWDPSFRPSAESLLRAESELRAKRSGRRKRAGKLDAGPPEIRTKGRAERRWRRQVMMLASNLSLQQSTCRDLIVRQESVLDRWLVKNRMLISKHVERAFDRCMGDSQTDVAPVLQPLIMPDAIYRRRRRPINDLEAWLVIGDDVPYDFIPVSVAKSSKNK